MDDNKQLSDAASAENVSNHAINNDPHDKADGQLLTLWLEMVNLEEPQVTQPTPD